MTDHQKHTNHPRAGSSPYRAKSANSAAWGDKQRGHVDFDAVNSAALSRLQSLLDRWLPDGRRVGHEWVARNPRRNDRHAGSFKINLHNGRWSDFATGDRGGDVISLAAYLDGLTQVQAAYQLANCLGVQFGKY